MYIHLRRWLSLSSILTHTSDNHCPGFKGGHGVVVCVRSRAPACKCIPSPRAIEDIEKKYRHRRLDGYPQTWEMVSPRIPVRSRAFESSTNSTYRHPTWTLLGGACSQVSGKRGKIWVNPTRRARAMRWTTTTTFDLFTYNSPRRSPTSLVEIWHSHEGLSLRQRNPPLEAPVAARGRQYWGRGIVEEGVAF
jgi:hypothetical protein